MKAETKIPPETRWWDPLAALLLVCALMTAAGRLVVTRWTEDLYLVQTLTLFGVVLGLVLGQTRFSARLSTLIAAGYTIFIVPWQLAVPIQALDALWKDRLLILFNRVMLVADELARDRPVSDNILFLLIMSLAFWALSIYSGYSLTRHGSAWRAALPIGLALFVIHTYDPLVTRRAWFLAAFLLFSLLMVARLAYARQRLGWRQNRTYVPPDIGFDWIRFTLVVAVVLVVFSWTVPALAETLPAAEKAWLTVKRPWTEFSDNFSNWFDSLQTTVGVYNEYYSDSFTLTLGNALSDEVVLKVDAPARGFAGMRYYWRAYAYDNYSEGKWTSTVADKQVVTPQEFSQLPLPKDQNRMLGNFVFHPQHSIATIYVAPQPVWVSRQVTAFVATSTDGVADLVAMQAMPAVVGGDSYQVRAQVTAVTIARLREAGTDYPQWVKDRYLELPENITPRTRELAQKIATDLDNPYDIAQAVTEYLRTYEYSETIEAPPKDRELVDWWLFDYGKGFCQYYATAEVVLLRSLGIPARWAVGYAEGEFQGKSDGGPGGGFEENPDERTDVGGTYIVRERDLHTWPEVYFPGTGWVEFEPTAGQSAIVRPSGEKTDNGASNADEEEALRRQREQERLDALAAEERATSDRLDPLAATNQTAKVVRVVAGVTSLGLLGLGVFVWRKRMPIPVNAVPLPVRLEKGMRRFGLKPPAFLRRWAYYASLSPLTHAYLEINRALNRLGKPPALYATPSERAASLSALLPVLEPAVKTLIAEYQLSVYSQKQADSQSARQAGAEIRKESWRAWLHRFIPRRGESVVKYT